MKQPATTQTQPLSLQRKLAIAYVGLSGVGLAIIMFYRQIVSVGTSQYPVTIAIAMMLLGYLAAVVLIHLQSYKYIAPIFARLFARGRLPLDERENALRGKVFEQGYGLVSIFGVLSSCYLAFVNPQPHDPVTQLGMWPLWIVVNIIVLFIVLASVLAAFQDADN